MARPYILPLGFIRHATEDGVIFTLSNAQDSTVLTRKTPVTVWRYSPEHLALAKIRGLITAVGYVTATFRTVESAIDPRWPEERKDSARENPGLSGPGRHLRTAPRAHADSGTGRHDPELWPAVQEPEGRQLAGLGSKPRSRRRTMDFNHHTANAQSLTNTVHSEKL